MRPPRSVNSSGIGIIGGLGRIGDILKAAPASLAYGARLYVHKYLMRAVLCLDARGESFRMEPRRDFPFFRISPGCIRRPRSVDRTDGQTGG